MWANVSAWNDPGCAGTGGCAQLLKIVFQGPATGVWFGIAFDAFNMADAPYAVIVEPMAENPANVSVFERRLGYHDGGTPMASSVTVRGVEVSDGAITVTVTRPMEVIDTEITCVGLACKPTAEHGSFEPNNLEMPVLLALGFSHVYAHHRDKVAGKLAYDVDEAGVCLCTASSSVGTDGNLGSDKEETGPVAESSKSLEGVIIGGSVAAVLLVVVAIVWRRRLRRVPEPAKPELPISDA